MIMVWRCTLLLFGMFLALGTGVAAAKEVPGVLTFLSRHRRTEPRLTLNGLGVRKATLLKINVYVAALYVTNTVQRPKPDPSDRKHPHKLILHFVRDVGAGGISNGFDEGFCQKCEAADPCLARAYCHAGWLDARFNDRSADDFHYQAGSWRSGGCRRIGEGDGPGQRLRQSISLDLAG